MTKQIDLQRFIGTPDRMTAALKGEPAKAGPMSDNTFDPVPFHGLRIPGMKMAAFSYKVSDALGI